jgi:hypothetical protein
MSQYLILIYHDEAAAAAFERAQPGVTTAAHRSFMERNRDVILGGNALQPTATATTVRPDRRQSFIVTNAPFAETKEALGGYYLIEAANLDDALAVAEQVPSRFGCLEVRPVHQVG